MHHDQPNFFNLTNDMPNFGAEKSASVTPEASQQVPAEFLVTIFHTKHYQSVPECATLGQREACLVSGLPSL